MALKGEAYIESPLKRSLDIVGGTAIGLGSLPVALAVAGEIVAEKRSPLFMQKRRGLGGREFTMYKFQSIRSHVANELNMGGADHPHTSALGRLIRAAGLDELPQLANVVKGDMGLVGIRPMPDKTIEAFKEAVDDEELYDEWRRCYDRYPGLTGEGQLYTKQFNDHDNPAMIRQRMEIDIDSFYNASFTDDLRILACSPPVVLGAAARQILPGQSPAFEASAKP